MYSSALGRFLQRDPAQYASPLDLYQFANGAPVNNVDPFGRDASPAVPASIGSYLPKVHGLPNADDVATQFTGIGIDPSDPKAAAKYQNTDFVFGHDPKTDEYRIISNIQFNCPAGQHAVQAFYIAWLFTDQGGNKKRIADLGNLAETPIVEELPPDYPDIKATNVTAKTLTGIFGKTGVSKITVRTVVQMCCGACDPTKMPGEPVTVGGVKQWGKGKGALAGISCQGPKYRFIYDHVFESVNGNVVGTYSVFKAPEQHNF